MRLGTNSLDALELGEKTGIVAVTGAQERPSGLASPSGMAWGAGLFVWGFWLLAFLGTLGFVGKYSHDVPYREDWDRVRFITGEDPNTLDWIWMQRGEHRCVLMKSTLIALSKLTPDFRAPIFFNALVLGGLAFAMIRAAKTARGWTHYADVFFPLALLNLQFMHMGSYLGEQIFYLLPTAVAGTLLVVIVQQGTRLTFGTAIVAGVCLILLPLCGLAGLVYMVPLVGWFGYCGVKSWRLQEPRVRLKGSLILALTLVSVLLLLPLFFTGYQMGTNHVPPNPGLRTTLKSGLAFLAASFGVAAAEPVWPYSGLVTPVLLTLSAVTLVVVVWRPKQSLDRPRALGLLLFMSATAALALAVGWGRASLGLSGVMHLYSTLSILSLCSVYYSWCICRPGAAGYFAQMCLFTMMALAVPLTIRRGVEEAAAHHTAMEALEQDLRAGEPPFMLLARHGSALEVGCGQSTIADRMRMLQRAQIGVFRFLGQDPALRELPLPVVPAAVSGLRWEEGTCHGTGPESFVVFTLPEPRFVAGVRIRGAHSSGTIHAFRVFWKKPDEPDFPRAEQYYWWLGLEDGLTIYVGNTIDKIRIHPDDKSFDFRFSEIVLLIPETQESQGDRPKEQR